MKVALVSALLLAGQVGCGKPPKYRFIVLDDALITDTARAELVKELATLCPDVEVVAWRLPLGIIEMFLHREPPRPHWFLSIWPSDGDGNYHADGSAWGWNIGRRPSDEELKEDNELFLTGKKTPGQLGEIYADRRDRAKTLMEAAAKLCVTVKDPTWLPRAQT